MNLQSGLLYYHAGASVYNQSNVSFDPIVDNSNLSFSIKFKTYDGGTPNLIYLQSLFGGGFVGLLLRRLGNNINIVTLQASSHELNFKIEADGFVALTLTKDAEVIKAYVDGDLVATIDATEDSAGLTDTTVASDADSQEPMEFKDLYIHTRALTETEVVAIANL